MMRQKRPRHLMMPTTPRAGCIMIHSQCRFAFFQRGLDRPAPPAHPYQCRAWTPGRCVTHVVRDLRPWLQTPAEDNPHLVAKTASTLARCPHKGARSRERPFAPCLDRGLSPIVRCQWRAELLHFLRLPCSGGHTPSGPWRSPRAWAWREALHLLRPDVGRLWDLGAVAFSEPGHAIEQGRIHPVVCVSRDPLTGQLSALGHAL